MALTKRQAYKNNTKPDTNADTCTIEEKIDSCEWTSDPEIAVERLRKKGIDAHVSDAEVIIHKPYTQYLEHGSKLIEDFGKTLKDIGYGCAYGINFDK